LFESAQKYSYGNLIAGHMNTLFAQPLYSDPGKGTGALKRTVKEILDKHDNVKDFYFAPIESGGEGITIVELK